MTIKELKEFIKDLPDDMPVLTGGFDECGITDAEFSKVEAFKYQDSDVTRYININEYREVYEPYVSKKGRLIDAVIIDLNKWD